MPQAYSGDGRDKIFKAYLNPPGITVIHSNASLRAVIAPFLW